jgi:[CysO sulfur-carrier protein]-S-L-cysteine hydrolase
VVTTLRQPASPPGSPGDAEAYYPGDLGHAHPGPASIELPASIHDAIVRHARASLPNEACGLIVGDRPAAAGGRAMRWEPMVNALASPSRYEIDPADLLRLSIAIDDADETIWGIVHSHVASPARPSPTDVRQSLYPDAVYLLVSLDPAEQRAGEPSLRAWRIVSAAVHEVAVRPTESP